MRGVCLALVAGLVGPAAAQPPPPCEARLQMVCAASPCAAHDAYCAQEHLKTVRLTYANRSCAEADSAKVLSEGACPDDPAAGAAKREMLCPTLYAPVLASHDGKPQSYPNRCEMAADGAVLMHTLPPEAK